MAIIPCGKSLVTLHTEAELPGTTFASPAEKQAFSTAMTATAQEMHRPIINAEYQNCNFLTLITCPPSMTQPHSAAPRPIGFLLFFPSSYFLPRAHKTGCLIWQREGTGTRSSSYSCHFPTSMPNQSSAASHMRSLTSRKMAKRKDCNEQWRTK